MFLFLNRLDFTPLNSGSTQPLLTQGTLKKQDLVYPDRSLLEAFSRVTRDLFEKIEKNNHESNALAAIRDLLLPKLMTGEIRVREAEKIAGEAI
uniref:Type I restriction modification DNA specificity domain-containing protein n=1 Tax=Candidatus Kentrum sp. TUN TaxID=2126343 RepID=A0A451AD96_9GAMM|nr:MAG: hypothetical protein BECKTUN1418D_GA0071000_12362 [Candidatus Kentron sp. TUN]